MTDLPSSSSRRRFLQAGAAALGGLAAPALVAAESARPVAAEGLQFGDPLDGSAVVWSRSDRPARMIVEWSLDEHFTNATRIVGPHALEAGDFTARQDLVGLPPGRDVFVRVGFQGLDNARALGEPVLGRLRTPPVDGGDLRFVWGGDTAGQGWGINPAFGGMRIYEAMRRRQPHFFLHSGDTIYADGPIAATAVAEGGATWTNLVTPEVAKVAETLDEFRGRYRYNLLDDNLRRFNAEVAQWRRRTTSKGAAPSNRPTAPQRVSESSRFPKPEGPCSRRTARGRAGSTSRPPPRRWHTGPASEPT